MWINHRATDISILDSWWLVSKVVFKLTCWSRCQTKITDFMKNNSKSSNWYPINGHNVSNFCLAPRSTCQIEYNLCMCSGVRRSFLACMLTCFQRSLGQGNIFTSVCHSVHRGVGFPACITGHMTRRSLHLGRSASREICIQGGVCIQGRDLHPGRGLHTRGWSTSRRGEVCIQGGVCIRGVGQTPPAPHQIVQDTVNKERYYPIGMYSCLQLLLHHE